MSVKWQFSGGSVEEYGLTTSGALGRTDDVDEGRATDSGERGAVTGVQLCAVEGGEGGGRDGGGQQGGGHGGGVRASVDDTGDDRVEEFVTFVARLGADEHGHGVIADVFGHLERRFTKQKSLGAVYIY